MSHTVNFRVDKEMVKELRREAKSRYFTFSQYLRWCLLHRPITKVESNPRQKKE